MINPHIFELMSHLLFEIIQWKMSEVAGEKLWQSPNILPTQFEHTDCFHQDCILLRHLIHWVN